MLAGSHGPARHACCSHRLRLIRTLRKRRRHVKRMRHHQAKATRQKRGGPRLNAMRGTMHEPTASQECADDLFLDEEDLGAYLSETASTDPPWNHADLPGEAPDALTDDVLGPNELAAGDGGAGRVDEENLALRYLREISTVPLLTPAEEGRLAKAVQELKARLQAL